MLASILLTELLGEFATVLRDLTGVNIVTSEAHSGPPVLNHDAQHRDIRVLDDRRGGLLRNHHPPGPPPWQLTSVVDLQTAIGTYIDAWNERCAPFHGAQDADTRLAKATRLKPANTRETSVGRLHLKLLCGALSSRRPQTTGRTDQPLRRHGSSRPDDVDAGDD